jgi:MFS family permease
LSDIALHDPYEALRIPDYRRLVAGGLLSSVGLGVQTVAVGWEIYLRTRSFQYLAYTGLAQFLPVLFFTLPAGQVADRFPRKHVFRIAQATSGLASLGLVYLSLTNAPVALFFACLVLTGVGRAFMAPSRASLLAQVVPAHTLPNAVNWNSTAWQFANVVGPALGGFVLAVSATHIAPPQLTVETSSAVAGLIGAAADGEFASVAGTVGGTIVSLPAAGEHVGAAAYAVAALCSIGSILFITFIYPRPIDRPTTSRTLASLLVGVKFVLSRQLILAAMTLDLFAVLLGGATALLPVYANDILRVGAVGLGMMRAAPAVGAAIMALILAHRPPMSRPGVALLFSVAAFGAATIAFGLSQSFLFSLVVLMLLGAFDNVSVVVRGTLVQVLTPDEMRGRVSAVNTLFISSSNELGEFESGMVADLLGTVGSVVFGGVGTIVVVILALLKWPGILTIGPLHKLRPTPLPEDAMIPVVTTNPSVVASSGEINQAIRAAEKDTN